ncbi:MAG: ImmA/IrrE family metallo-endopeptidase, partial [Delftia sp.]|nr:ImmA/IrrE family metallo-endopeptidase [Delftia sp.]
MLQPLESVGVPDQQARAIAASREKPGSKGKKLRQLIRERIERLAELTDEAAASAEMQRWFQFVAQFHRYSFSNRCLILLQRPDASQVAGYKAWQRLGRQVRKGEKGIAIIVPRVWRKEVEDPASNQARQERGLYFRVGHVFDIDQTEGDEPPEPPQWIDQGDQGTELAERLTGYARSLDIEVREAQLPGQRQGESHGGTVLLNRDASPLGKAATLAHEIAHELMHGPEQRVPGRRRLNELEAEACAYVVCEHFG